jgi:hypothetical protein
VNFTNCGVGRCNTYISTTPFSLCPDFLGMRFSYNRWLESTHEWVFILNLARRGVRLGPLLYHKGEYTVPVYRHWYSWFFSVGEGEETPAPLRLIGGNAKSLRLKSGLEKVFAVAVIFLRPPPLLSHCPGALEQLCSPIQSLKVLQCMVSNTTQHPLSPPQNLQYTVQYCSLGCPSKLVSIRNNWNGNRN